MVDIKSFFPAPKINFLPSKDYVGALAVFTATSLITSIALLSLKNTANSTNDPNYYSLGSGQSEESFATPDAYARLLKCCKINALQMSGIFIPTLYLIGRGAYALDELSSYANALVVIVGFIGATTLCARFINFLQSRLPAGYYDANPLRLIGGFDMKDPIILSATSLLDMKEGVAEVKENLFKWQILQNPPDWLRVEVSRIQPTNVRGRDEGIDEGNLDPQIDRITQQPQAVQAIPLHTYGVRGPSLDDLSQGPENFRRYIESWKSQSICMINYALKAHGDIVEVEHILSQTGQEADRALLSEDELNRLANDLYTAREQVENLTSKLDIIWSTKKDSSEAQKTIKEVIYRSLRSELFCLIGERA